MVKSISKDEKHKLEEKAVDTLLNEALFDNDFKNLWLEYENKTTKEAVFVKEVDKLEPILQSIAYGVKPKNYFKDEVITIPCLRKVLNDAYNLSNIE